MIYSINLNNKKGIGFIGGNSSEVILKPCSGREELKTHFVFESEKVNTASCSEPEASSSKVMTKSKPENQETKVMNNSKSKAQELQKTRQDNFRQRTQRKINTPWTNPRGHTKIWVPKTDIVDVAGVSKRKRKAEVLVPGQWLLATHDGRQVFVPNPNHERGRNCGIWRKPNWQDHWFWYDR